MSRNFLFTSESVSEGHPDKVCDFIADSVLDACLEQDPLSRVACEVLCKDEHVILAGEITTRADVDYEAVARRAIREVGYTIPDSRFHADKVRVQVLLGLQSPQIACGVDGGGDLGAGDQGLVFGFATRETPELMPLPITLAHRITRALAEHRRNGAAPFLRPDAKSQATVRYSDGRPVAVTDVVVSTQHAPEVGLETVRGYVLELLLPAALGDWFGDTETRVLVNPAGPFDLGGPEADCGVTGRKIIVDTYGGWVPHGGGAFSGKDATKVDRSAAYFARHVARQVVQAGLAESVTIQVAYAIGLAAPVAIHVDTRGTGDDGATEDFVRSFDHRPAAIIGQLGLRRPVFRQSTNYGHFGRPDLPWEQDPVGLPPIPCP